MIEEMYARYFERIASYLTSVAGDRGLAEEAAQEAFLRAMAHEGEIASLAEPQARVWLFRTAKRVLLDRLRRGRREIVTDSPPERMSLSSETELAEWLLLLSSLPGEEGTLFVMRYLQGYTSEQIGRIMGMPPGTVRFRLSQARAHLREALKNQ